MDCGSVIDQATKSPDLTARFILKAMTMMGYDAMNLSALDLALDQKALEEMAAYSGLPLVSSNLKGNPAFWQPFRIVTVDGIRVAILGVVDADSVPSETYPDTVPAVARDEGDASRLARQGGHDHCAGPVGGSGDHDPGQ